MMLWNYSERNAKVLSKLQRVKSACNSVFLSGYHTVCCGEDQETRCYEDGRLFLRCLSCGWESAGWEVGEQA